MTQAQNCVDLHRVGNDCSDVAMLITTIEVDDCVGLSVILWELAYEVSGLSDRVKAAAECAWLTSLSRERLHLLAQCFSMLIPDAGVLDSFDALFLRSAVSLLSTLVDAFC